VTLWLKTMPVAHEFEYFKPATLNEAISLLSKYDGSARVLAGGTDLALKIKEGTETPDVVVDIKGIETLKRLDFEGNRLFVGSLVTFSNLIDSQLVIEKFPLLRDASSTIGSVGIRNRATMAGNICSAVPSLDSGPALLVYEAEVLTKSADGGRTIPIDEWFVGPKQSALKTGEIVTSISVPLPEETCAGCYVKLGRYAGEDLAQAGVGILALEGNEYRVAFCAVGPVPKRSEKIEALLNGNELTDALIEDAKALIPEEISPITDIRSSKEYRMLMVKIMFERGIKAAVSRLTGNRPENGAIWV
jgi:CO/xanthine dehydrogenase FAD-binding subunit